MPKPSDYTPARRRTMQIVVWLILLGTIGLAAAVERSAKRANRVDLAPQSTTINDVTVRLPNRWRPRPRGDDPRVIIQAAEESPAGQSPRVVTVLCDPLTIPMSPLQYLDANFGVLQDDPATTAGDYSVTSSARVAGRPGVIVMVQGAPSRSRREIPKDLYGCTILPSMRAVVVHLRGTGVVNHNDRAVIGTIAAAVQITGSGDAGAKAGDALTLPNGIALTVPAGFVAIDEKDENVTERRLWPAAAMTTQAEPRPRSAESAQQLESEWTTMELVGCVIPSDGADEQSMPATFATLLLSHDPTWRGASVAAAGNNVWRAEPATAPTGETPFPSRAYLKLDPPQGTALLAIFRGGVGGGEKFEATWSALAASIKFPPDPSVAQFEQAGAAEVARLRAAGFEKLIPERQEQWWLWTGGGERPYLGWSHLDFGLGGLAGKGETRLHRKGGAGGAGSGDVAQINDEFSYRDSDRRYRAETIRTEPNGEDVRPIQQTTALSSDDQLTIAMRQRGTTSTQSKGASPPQFIPGELLPLLMGQLRPTTPIMIRSESFPGGAEAIGPPAPLALLVRENEASTRKAEGEDQPMRCVMVEVNGSGRVSRWFFRRSGELECVEFPAGVRRVSADAKMIEFDFGKTGAMAP